MSHFPLRLNAGLRSTTRSRHKAPACHPCYEGLDWLLARQGRIENGLAKRHLSFALSDMAKTQHIAQARRRRLVIHRTYKAQLRAWRDQPVDHHRDNEIAIATGFGILRSAEDQTVERNLEDHPQH